MFSGWLYFYLGQGLGTAAVRRIMGGDGFTCVGSVLLEIQNQQSLTYLTKLIKVS